MCVHVESPVDGNLVARILPNLFRPRPEIALLPAPVVPVNL